MARRVVITGLGPVSALGLGVEALWRGAVEGRSALGRIEAWDASGFDTAIGGEVKPFSVKEYVPKSYRKASKVMARDIEFAVTAANLAVRDAGLKTKGVAPDQTPSYSPHRFGAQIGAGLIAAELNELTLALAGSRDADGVFDIHRWGAEGMQDLTPLWLLKYLPNMLACHVTIIHDCQGPSNTITCQEASSGLSIGEALRVIERNDADASVCGGADSKLNPMAFLRQLMTGRYNTHDDDHPARAVRPFCQSAAGGVIGEGGGIVILEALETFEKRAANGNSAAHAYAEVVGFGASQSVNRPKRNLQPDQAGRSIALAIQAALREANVKPNEVHLIAPMGLGFPETDRAEAAALKKVFGDSLNEIPLVSTKPLVGNCLAGSGVIDVCLAAKALAEQTLPARINCDQPIEGLCAKAAASQPADLQYALTYAAGVGGQNAAIVLKRMDQ